ncbi:hypothetical protein [Celeribacter naphthalenivorans]|uniref:hypothetical protein n=1 Tax=Celeribacter naphthalenivorans TaxID=1614694 RepID=UPI001CF94E9A|nr:hypothetical protein [Celeribacter naphthalenivorans]
MSCEFHVLATKSIGRKPGPARDEPAQVMAHPAVIELDHSIVEREMAALPSKSARAEFWREHVHILGSAFLDRGMSREAVEAILSDHFNRVRELHRKRIKEERGDDQR